MASLSLILSPSNFSPRSDVFGNKLFNGRSLAMKGTGTECYGSKRVEEVSQAKADFRRRLEKQDPLEYYCQDNPEVDECRVYED
ncbi:hypothetical protein SADUNF_Sadunf02G0001700 [Salix dunnii]|uniref:CP12 domain-containing protein n=1 Tax=Salix dunnii TaxID=1413687 RepID=A0A835N5B3_9ROSI|nr:hypothetical protein SADUNF_Sadunf02G0001700 [Salix dunnii]